MSNVWLFKYLLGLARGGNVVRARCSILALRHDSVMLEGQGEELENAKTIFSLGLPIHGSLILNSQNLGQVHLLPIIQTIPLLMQ